MSSSWFIVFALLVVGTTAIFYDNPAQQLHFELEKCAHPNRFFIAEVPRSARPTSDEIVAANAECARALGQPRSSPQFRQCVTNACRQFNNAIIRQQSQQPQRPAPVQQQQQQN